jgi:hypothetical protein
MPIWEFECKCGSHKELIVRNNEGVFCDVCGRAMTKLFPSGTSFQLVYNPKKDKVDWHGNTTRRYEEINKSRK